MKISELWLREWVNPNKTREALCHELTMSGLEIESMSPVAEKFSGVVVGTVLQVEKHPEADRLKVCAVDVGQEKALTIVCGANNVTVGMKAATALEGAVLADKTAIKVSKLRGVTSYGMLCSARELGLAEESDGLFILPPDAPVGVDAWDYLNLSDYVLDVSITPNRGDCLSVYGLSHEIAALMKCELHAPAIVSVQSVIADALSVKLSDDCPRYAGRIIRQVKADANTPIWMQERLRRSGIRRISAVVDIMNYVMLELGQPMHAFDLEKISGGIQVRKATAGEVITLLDGQTITLTGSEFLIADNNAPLALAGVMGGLDSAVTLLTQDVFLESAFFQPEAIARMERQYHLGSDSSYRFERGVDPTLQVRAIERATQLIIEICGGQPGPVTDIKNEKLLPQPKVVHLRADRIKKILGMDVSATAIESAFKRLSFSYQAADQGWDVTAPARRFDIALEEDLIEEIARMQGYDSIPTNTAVAHLQMNSRSERKIYLPQLRRTLSDMGYQEVITYSFIDKKLQTLFDPQPDYKTLVNPMTADMAIMRTTLWPGLVNTLLYNQNRQQSRAKIFEIGMRFICRDGQLLQESVISGLISGSLMPEQWGASTRPVDFFDLKGDIENLLQLTLAAPEIEFRAGSHTALHPGQTAMIWRGSEMGVIGALHPSIAQKLDIIDPVYLFEVRLDALEVANLPYYSEISKFPSNRRDIAILVDRAIPSEQIRATIVSVAGDLLQEVSVFDVYQGKGVASDRKSVALALTLQHTSRTLVDEEVTDLMERVIVALKDKFAAELRG